jgi:hypothetical protein
VFSWLLFASFITGKTFAATRLNDLLNNQSQLNVSSSFVSIADHPAFLFAREKGLDFAKLKTDYDYKVEHYSDLFKYTIKHKKAHPNWRQDALVWVFGMLRDRASTDPARRQAFVIDDVTAPEQLEYLQEVVSSGVIKGAELVKVRFNADDATREARGYRASARAAEDVMEKATEWNFTFDNNGNDAASVMALDTFLADVLVREMAK